MLRYEGRKLEVKAHQFHLPASSPVFQAYRGAMRGVAEARMRTRSGGSHYSFIALYSASEETRMKVQARFLEYVDWVREYTQEQGGPVEQVFQMNFDLLRWTES